jgi:hypothetical protein
VLLRAELRLLQLVRWWLLPVGSPERHVQSRRLRLLRTELLLRAVLLLRTKLLLR